MPHVSLPEVIPRVWSDSSACRGIVRRTGRGRLRHLEVRHAEGCSHGSQLGGSDDEASVGGWG